MKIRIQICHILLSHSFNDSITTINIVICDFEILQLGIPKQAPPHIFNTLSINKVDFSASIYAIEGEVEDKLCSMVLGQDKS